MFYDLHFNADDLEPFAAREKSATASSLGYNVMATTHTAVERLTAKDRCISSCISLPWPVLPLSVWTLNLAMPLPNKPLSNCACILNSMSIGADNHEPLRVLAGAPHQRMALPVLQQQAPAGAQHQVTAS